jgi:hypothetical protein
MNCLRLPLFTELEQARAILVAGAGGGFDIFSGLPLYFGLRDTGRQAYLANLSFSHLAGAAGRRFAPAALEVTADSWGVPGCFPEYHPCSHRPAGNSRQPSGRFDPDAFDPEKATRAMRKGLPDWRQDAWL